MKWILSAVLSLTAVAPALASPTDGVVDLEILPGWRSADGTHMAALQLTLAPGWKTYWRVPGDGGSINNLRSIGYEGIVVIPVQLAVTNADAPVQMVGQMQIGVCEEICVPVMLDFDATLLVSRERDPAIVAALIDRPRTAREAGVGAVACAIEPNEDGLQMTASIDLPASGGIEEVVIETGDQRVWVSEPDTWRSDGVLYAQSDLIHVEGGGFTVNRSDVRITVFAGGTAIDIHGCSAG